MKGSVPFLTFTAADPRSLDGNHKVISVPLSQVREIREQQFPTEYQHPLAGVQAMVTMAGGKDAISYWTLESRAALVDQANGLT